jgi:hypothetical protein
MDAQDGENEDLGRRSREDVRTASRQLGRRASRAGDGMNEGKWKLGRWIKYRFLEFLICFAWLYRTPGYGLLFCLPEKEPRRSKAEKEKNEAARCSRAACCDGRSDKSIKEDCSSCRCMLFTFRRLIHCFDRMRNKEGLFRQKPKCQVKKEELSKLNSEIEYVEKELRTVFAKDVNVKLASKLAHMQDERAALEKEMESTEEDEGDTVKVFRPNDDSEKAPLIALKGKFGTSHIPVRWERPPRIRQLKHLTFTVVAVESHAGGMVTLEVIDPNVKNSGTLDSINEKIKFQNPERRRASAVYLLAIVIVQLCAVCLFGLMVVYVSTHWAFSTFILLESLLLLVRSLDQSDDNNEHLDDAPKQGQWRQLIKPPRLPKWLYLYSDKVWNQEQNKNHDIEVPSDSAPKTDAAEDALHQTAQQQSLNGMAEVAFQQALRTSVAQTEAICVCRGAWSTRSTCPPDSGRRLA